MKEIKITIDKSTGEIKTEAFGYTGIDCKFDLDNILEKIKAETIYSEPKTEENIETVGVFYGDNNRKR